MDPPLDQVLKPTDLDFYKHYAKLLNSEPREDHVYTPDTPKYIPVLDDPILPIEVDHATNVMKQNRFAGGEGVPPGVLKLLTTKWTLLITFMFDSVFVVTYPMQWTFSKVFNIYKKGDRLDTGNYRGISILVALAKLYDLVLSRRFNLWYVPKYEQAGDQKGRGCEEQMLTIRLLIDIACKSKHTLHCIH